MEIIKEEITYRSVTKKYTIELADGRKIHLYKWWCDDPELDQYECDWEFAQASQEIVDSLSDEENDELYDFINGLN